MGRTPVLIGCSYKAFPIFLTKASIYYQAVQRKAFRCVQKREAKECLEGADEHIKRTDGLHE